MSRDRHQQQIRLRFSAAAKSYHEAATFQAEIAQQVIDLLPARLQPGRVLDVGCGLGALLQLARRRWPEAHLVGLDLSEAMIEHAKPRFGKDPRLAWAVGDAARYQAKPFDAMVSSSSLHWVKPLPPALQHLVTLLKPGGWLAAGLMTDGTFGELRASRAVVAPHKQAPGRLPSFDEIRQAVKSLPGCRVHLAREQSWIVHYPGAHALIRRLHDMGVTGGDISQGRVPLTRRELADLIAHYDRSYARPGGGVNVTYTVAFICVERL